MELSYEDWMDEVDSALENICGLNHYDLADQTWRDWFDDEMEPEEAARECLENKGFLMEME